MSDQNIIIRNLLKKDRASFLISQIIAGKPPEDTKDRGWSKNSIRDRLGAIIVSKKINLKIGHMTFDKRLKDLEDSGLITSEKYGRSLYYKPVPVLKQVVDSIETEE